MLSWSVLLAVFIPLVACCLLCVPWVRNAAKQILIWGVLLPLILALIVIYFSAVLMVVVVALSGGSVDFSSSWHFFATGGWIIPAACWVLWMLDGLNYVSNYPRYPSPS